MTRRIIAVGRSDGGGSYQVTQAICETIQVLYGAELALNGAQVAEHWSDAQKSGHKTLIELAKGYTPDENSV